MILQPDDVDATSEDDKWVLLTVQPRLAAGSLAFTEIPAGMIDDSHSFSGAAAKEVEEETSIKITEDELLDMSNLAAPQTTSSDWKTARARAGPSTSGNDMEALEIAAYPSPGACDEAITQFLYQKRLPRNIIESLRDLETGIHGEGEKITLKLVKLEHLWREGSRDGKTLAALALYEGLRREGKIPKVETMSDEKSEEVRKKLKEKNTGASKM
jgi:ADP-sugar diphosphatase